MYGLHTPLCILGFALPAAGHQGSDSPGMYHGSLGFALPAAGHQGSDSPGMYHGSDVQCAAAGENCMESKCCADASQHCFQKNDYWASCNASCSPNMKWVDNAWKEQVEHVWDCDKLTNDEPVKASPGGFVDECKTWVDGTGSKPSTCSGTKTDGCYKGSPPIGTAEGAWCVDGQISTCQKYCTAIGTCDADFCAAAPKITTNGKYKCMDASPGKGPRNHCVEDELGNQTWNLTTTPTTHGGTTNSSNASVQELPPTASQSANRHAPHPKPQEGKPQTRRKPPPQTVPRSRDPPAHTPTWSATSDAYRCDAGPGNAEDTWSDAKKAWCCANQRKGCQLAKLGGSMPGNKQRVMELGEGMASATVLVEQRQHAAHQEQEAPAASGALCITCGAMVLVLLMVLAVPRWRARATGAGADENESMEGRLLSTNVAPEE